MSRRRSIALVGGVVALLLVVALAAVGRPLGKHAANGGGGLPSTFWDVVYTSVIIVLVLGALFSVGTFFLLRRPAIDGGSFDRSRTVRALAILISAAALVYFIGQHIDLHRLTHHNHAHATTPIITTPDLAPFGGKPVKRPTHFEWPEAVVIAGALLAVLAVYLTRSRARPALRRRDAAPEELLAALDVSVDDLRSDPDLRHAIIAAYARMERALAAAGIPRRPAEAPFEYLERVLLALDTSDAAVRRLTDLFEWARFSHHEPKPSMRDEAIDALVAVRDELRAEEPVATW